MISDEIVTRCDEIMQAHAGLLSPELYSAQKIKELEADLLEALRVPQLVSAPPPTPTEDELIEEAAQVIAFQMKAQARAEEIVQESAAVVSPEATHAVEADGGQTT